MFDWAGFLDRNQIAYRRDGNHARLSCPFCAPVTDHISQRMAIELSGKGWFCFVGREKHSGISPNRLVAALLKCSPEQAAIITGVRPGHKPPPDNFEARIDALLKPQALEPPEPLQWPGEFRPIDAAPSVKPFVRYLRGRGFTERQIMGMTRQYGLHCCLHGYWRYRIIFPIHHNGKLVAWTGRSIVKHEPKRYRAEGKAPHYLLWQDELRRGGDCIALTEGPFDALKLRMLGLPATCFFTAQPSLQQIDLLYDLLPRFKRRLLMLDQGTFTTAMLTESRLRAWQMEIIALPPNVKDAAEICDKIELQSILTQALASA